MTALPKRRLPDDLTELRRWVLWRYEGEKRTKIPYAANGAYRASSVKPADWCDFDQAVEAWKRKPKEYSGLGFVFVKEDGLVGIDLDDCITDAGSLKPWAVPVVERFHDTYMEISPSGAGIKIWCRGGQPANLPKVPWGDGGIEMYDHGRYFTVTGNIWRGAPLQVEHHEEDVRLIFERLNPHTRPNVVSMKPRPEGGRMPRGEQYHQYLTSVTAALRYRLVCDDAILACLKAINERQCEQPKPLADLQKLVRETRKWEARA